MDTAIVTLTLFGLGMLAMVVPVLLLALFARDSNSANAP